jgi:methylated-DNA-[protein]-cysteine S-methyltransferase
MNTRYWYEIDSPVGRLFLAGDAAALTRVHFQSPGSRLRADPAWRYDGAAFATVSAELEEYFAGTRRAFSVGVALEGTDFQRKVWQALQAIPYGTTISYGELARRIGRPESARAVGLANGANPVPIIVPCHRVIGADGSLTGFGGGLDTKRTLLELEGASAVADLFQASR